MPDDAREPRRRAQPRKTFIRPREPIRDENRRHALYYIKRERQNSRPLARFTRNIRRPRAARTRRAHIRAFAKTHDEITERNRTEQVGDEDDEAWQRCVQDNDRMLSRES